MPKPHNVVKVLETPPKKDLTDQHFGRWTVKSFAGRKRVGKAQKSVVYWRCKCKCDCVFDVKQTNLEKGHSTQCVKCQRKKNRHKHGKRKKGQYDMTYAAWAVMRQRHVGEVDNSWTELKDGKGFRRFQIDMGKKPSPNHRLRRKDKTKFWSKENAYWENWKNGTATFYFDGAEHTVAELAWIGEKNSRTIRNRLKSGLTAEEAITCAVVCQNRNKDFFEAFNEKKRLEEWVFDVRFAIDRYTFLRRVRSGWAAERAMSEPLNRVSSRTKPTDHKIDQSDRHKCTQTRILEEAS